MEQHELCDCEVDSGGPLEEMIVAVPDGTEPPQVPQDTRFVGRIARELLGLDTDQEIVAPEGKIHVLMDTDDENDIEL